MRNFLLPTNYSNAVSGSFIRTCKFFQIFFFDNAVESFELRGAGGRLNKDRLNIELRNLESIKTHPRKNLL